MVLGCGGGGGGGNSEVFAGGAGCATQRCLRGVRGAQLRGGGGGLSTEGAGAVQADRNLGYLVLTNTRYIAYR